MRLSGKEWNPMSRPRHPGFTRRLVLLVAVALAGWVGLAPAAAGAQSDVKVTVMTRNLFLGADLLPALGATTLPQFQQEVGEILDSVVATDFPTRAKPLAREIVRTEPDLVGLQEVALWRRGEDGVLDGPATPATTVLYDFLDKLRSELARRAMPYRLVQVQQEFDLEGPSDRGFDLRLTMRDVILARPGIGIKVRDRFSSNFRTTLPLISPVVGQITVLRGWTAADISLGGADFRFINTHLEAFNPLVRLGQAQELIATGGPANTDQQVILVGDLNSGTEARHNILGTDQLAFLALLGFGMADNGAIHSCCYSDLFDETQVFDHTVDHVLTKPGLETTNAFVTGNDPAERTPSDLWPSDHGGVVSTLELKK
jgi:endonuclease/exonuclease/phosphatase family metal-dependent hydrolase